MKDVRTRWWIPPPVADESLRSVLNRAAVLYECEPAALWNELCAHIPDAAPEIDDPPAQCLMALAQVLSCRADGLHAHRIVDSPGRLSPSARKAYCPRCREDDMRSGRPAHDRRAWTYVLRTQCDLHCAPLRLQSSYNLASALVEDPPLAPVEREILEFVAMFGRTLEASLFHGAPWPARWVKSAAWSRNTLCNLTCNVGPQRAHVPLAYLLAPPGLARFIRAPSRPVDPARRVEWDNFRAIADPAIRRAALWAVGWNVVPELPYTLYPGPIEVQEEYA